MPRDYIYDQGFLQERARLAGIESLWDPGSQQLLDGLGIGAGWRCLEVGAGGGSLVDWMAGRGATVLAIDIDTRFVDPLAGDAVEVRRLDIRTDELPERQPSRRRVGRRRADRRSRRGPRRGHRLPLPRL